MVFDHPTSAHFGLWLSEGIFSHGLIVVVLYLVGAVGFDHGKLALLHSVASVLYALRKPYVMLADWNNPPDVFEASVWLQTIGGVISATERSTCLVKGSCRDCDYAVSHHWSFVPKASLHESWSARPHTAVRFDTNAKQAPIGISVFRRPRAFPAAAPFGPWPEHVELSYASAHDFRSEATNADQVTDAVKDQYGHIEE